MAPMGYTMPLSLKPLGRKGERIGTLRLVLFTSACLCLRLVPNSL